MTSTRLPFILVVATSVLVAMGSWRFLGLGLDLSFPPFGDHLATRRTAFLVHVTIAPIALVLGLFQFMTRLRGRHPGLHRWTGRAYVACIVLSGGAALLLAPFAPGGAIAGLGFAALAVAWFATTGKAVWHAVRREIAIHREWMIRSFALTFAGVTLRVYLAMFMLSGVDYVEASIWLAWICWVPNLLVAEWWIARTRRLTATKETVG